MKKLLITILHLTGFPLMIGLVVLANLNIMKYAASYGIFAYVGVIVPVLLGVIYLCVVVARARAKKRGTKQKIYIEKRNGKEKKKKIGERKHTLYNQTYVAMILCFCMLGGLWIGIGVVLPDILADLTSSTVFYEDLSEDYMSRAEVNKKLLNDFIEVNYNVHALDNGKSLKYYQDLGMKSKDVSDLLAIKFKSMDKDGYASYTHPWIDFALAGRMTIPDLVHLLLDDRSKPEEELQDFYIVMLDKDGYPIEGQEPITDPVMWGVLDMLGTPMSFNIQSVLDMIPENYRPLVNVAFPSVANVLTKVVEDERVLGSPIFLTLDDYGNLSLTPSNEVRGVPDYQSYAWLNSNGLLYAVVGLFSTRTIFLIFACWLVVSNFMIGLLRGMGKKEEQAQVEAQKQAKANNSPYVVPANNRYVEIDPNSSVSYEMANIRRELMRGNPPRR